MGAAELRSSPNMRRSTVVISGIKKTPLLSNLALLLPYNYINSNVFSHKDRF